MAAFRHGITLTIFFMTINSSRTDLSRFPFESSLADLPLVDDYPSCGLFKKYSQARVFNGEAPFKEQFPWSTCLLRLFYDYAHHLYQKDGNWFFVNKENVGPHSRNVEFNAVPKIGLNIRHHWTQLCTGSIIHENWVLTAAHCFEQLPNGATVYLTFGGTHCLKPVDHRKVVVWKFATDNRPATIYSTDDYWKHLNLHSKYRKNTHMLSEWDVSLVRIDDPLTLPGKAEITYDPKSFRLNRICIDSSINYNYQCGDDLYAIGFGLKGTVNDESLTFMKHSVQYDKGNNNQPGYWDPRFSWNLFQGSITGPLFYLASNFELSPDGWLKNIATCGGDSGGPSIKYLSYESTDESVASARALQVGILSTGSECTEVNLTRQVAVNGEAITEPVIKPSKYFKVSKVRDWIKTVIASETEKSSDHSVYGVQDGGDVMPINLTMT